MVRIALAETFCILAAALDAPEPGKGPGDLHNVVVVVVLQPGKLAFVASEHFQFRFQFVGDVHIFGRLGVQKTGVIHIENGNYVACFAQLGLIVGNGGAKCGVEGKFGSFYVVVHIVVGGVGDDKVRLRSFSKQSKPNY